MQLADAAGAGPSFRFWMEGAAGVHYALSGAGGCASSRVEKREKEIIQAAKLMNDRSLGSDDDRPVEEEGRGESGDYLLKLAPERPSGAAQARAAPSRDGNARRPVESGQRRSRLHSAHVLIIGFAGIILLGTLLLKLPAASSSGVPLSWIEALFTATSAVTVTGLGVLTTATDLTRFGQLIILVLLQVGGVGFIAFSVLLFRLVGRCVTLNERFMIQQSLGGERIISFGSRWGRLGSVVNLALYVLIVTLTIEAVGALLLWLRWRTAFPDGEALWLAIFHAVSSYCNAGFDLFTGSGHAPVFGFGADYFTLAVMAVLIILGGFGVAVLYDLGSFFRNRILALNTRITLALSGVLLLAGLAVMLLDRQLYEVTLSALNTGEQLAVSVFTVISARTAGLTLLPLEQLSQSTQLMLLFWMFVGGAPASMAGGVTSSTFGVLLISALATAKGGDNEAVAFGRSVPRETLNKAVAIMTVSTLLVAGVTMLLSLLHEGDIFALGFEVVSAFANAGYSLGVTSKLDAWGQAAIAFTMFWGRLGPLTIVIALAQRERPSLLHYPEEPVILG